jgi:uncharacterized membrane protein YfhO
VEPQEGSGSAQIVLYTPNKVTIHTASDVAKLLFLSDVFDPGWHAYVDGKKTPVLRADYDFRAVGLPPGNHVVEFRYFPDKLRIGFIVAGLASIAVCMRLFWKQR